MFAEAEASRGGEAHGPADVAESFSTITWGNGRELTTAVVEKILAVWSRINNVPRASAIIQTSFMYYGRSSLFDEWSKLQTILQKCTSDKDVVWTLEYFLFLKLRGRRANSQNVACSPLNRAPIERGMGQMEVEGDAEGSHDSASRN